MYYLENQVIPSNLLISLSTFDSFLKNAEYKPVYFLDEYT